MTKKILIMISVAVIIVLVGCSKDTLEVITAAKPSPTVVTTTTIATTTTQPQTTKAETTSTTHTTTKQTTTKPKPTTDKATKKVTTTKATTEPPYFCDEGGTHHSEKVGPIGWFKSYAEAQRLALRYIDDHADSGSFRVTQCQYCGKNSANITLDKEEEHNMPCGNVGKWYSNRDAFMNEYNSKVDYWNDKLDNNEISYEEYIKKVPRGYEIWQCADCGKWAGNNKHK